MISIRHHPARFLHLSSIFDTLADLKLSRHADYQIDTATIDGASAAHQLRREGAVTAHLSVIETKAGW